VHALGEAVALEHREIAPDGLAGDRQLLGEVDHGQAAVGLEAFGEQLLAFGGVHGNP
jgi:hypothetical protein